jgi:hypothetical protein
VREKLGEDTDIVKWESIKISARFDVFIHIIVIICHASPLAPRSHPVQNWGHVEIVPRSRP